MITHYPISWWVEKLKTPFSLARFGDGEFLCIEGKKGGNSHGCAYTHELREDLIACMKNPKILHGMQRILPSQFRRVRSLLEGEWVDTEVFGDALAAGELKPFMDALRERNLMIVSSKEKREIPLPYVHFVETPRTNAHANKQWILADIILRLEKGDIDTVLFACGMAAGTFVDTLSKMSFAKRVSFIDIGHIFDPFVGESSRDYLSKVSIETIMKNI